MAEMSRRSVFAVIVACNVMSSAHARIADAEWMRRFREFIKAFNDFVVALDDNKLDLSKWESMRTTFHSLEGK
jgi:hypothetical protein